MEDSFSTLSSPTSHRTLHSPPNHSPYFKRASGSYIEFEFLTSVDQHDGGLSRLVPLKLPPRLQSPCPTPPRSRGGSMPKRAGLRAVKNNNEFDPFTAALERIRKEEQERVVREGEMAGSTSPTSRAKHRRGKSSVILASAGRNHAEAEAEAEAEDEENDGDEIKMESSSSKSVFCYKPNLLACFILKK